MAKVFPQDDELLCDLYSRMKENILKLTHTHFDSSITVEQNTEENYLLVKSLTLGEQAN